VPRNRFVVVPALLERTDGKGMSLTRLIQRMCPSDAKSA
jgi:hypothetical protein